MLERVYLYDRFELEGYFTMSLNMDKIHEDMIISNQTDGYFMVLTPENTPELNIKINKDLQQDFDYSMEYYNKGVERNKTLPEKPEYDFEGASLDDICQMFEEEDNSKYKATLYKPTLQQINLNDFLVLETFT